MIVLTFAGAIQFVNDSLWVLVLIAYFVRWVNEDEREVEE